MARVRRTELPLEIIDLILSLVDRPGDLLVFATAAQRFHRAVVPKHLNYRIIRCGLQRRNLWRGLQEHPRQASGIRTLEIIDENKPTAGQYKEAAIVPPSIQGASSFNDLDFEDQIDLHLTAAVKLMPNLRRFLWNSPERRPPMKLLNTLIMTCPDIEEFELDFPWDENYLKHDQEAAELGQCQDWGITNLRSFAYSERKLGGHFSPAYSSSLQHLSHFLSLQHHLRDLHIYIENACDTQFGQEIGLWKKLLTAMPFPNLRRLNIQTRMFIDIAQEFFAIHPNLKTLKLVGDPHAGAHIDYWSMPELSAIELDWNPVISCHDSARGIPARLLEKLTHLRFCVNSSGLYVLHHDVRGTLLKRYLVRSATKLKSLIIDSKDAYSVKDLEALLYACTPSLERLALNCITTDRDVTGPIKCQNQIAKLFTRLTNLTHFSFVDIAGWEDAWSLSEPVKDVASALRVLANAALKLEFVAVKNHGDKEPLWVTIKRRRDGTYWSHQPTPVHGFRRDIDVKLWGGGYNGCGGFGDQVPVEYNDVAGLYDIKVLKQVEPCCQWYDVNRHSEHFLACILVFPRNNSTLYLHKLHVDKSIIEMPVLPREIFDLISAWVDQPRDLLSLATASKELCAIVIPEHLDYRLIRCDLSRFDLWRSLAKSSQLTSQIRYFEVIDEQAEYIASAGFLENPIAPSGLLGDRFEDDIDDERTICDNIKPVFELIPNLKRFHWTAQRQLPLQLLEVLCSTCPEIQEFELLISYDDLELDVDDCSMLSHSSVWGLKNVRRFSFSDCKSVPFFAVNYPLVLRSLAKFVTSQEHLQDLHIYIEEGDLQVISDTLDPLRSILKTANLPNLKRLNIQAQALWEIEEAFFVSHCNLEALTLTGPSYTPKINHSYWPDLTSLEVAWNPFMEDPSTQGRFAHGLMHLGMSLSKRDVTGLAYPLPLTSLLRHASNLTSLVVDTDVQLTHLDLRNLLASSMTIQRLALSHRTSILEGPVMSQHDIVHILGEMPNLTYLYYIDVSSWEIEPSGATFNNEAGEEEHERRGKLALRAVASAAPSLEFVAIKFDDSSDNFPEWMSIQRDSDRNYVGAEPTTYHEHAMDIDVKKWGGCYHGVDRGPRPPLY